MRPARRSWPVLAKITLLTSRTACRLLVLGTLAAGRDRSREGRRLASAGVQMQKVQHPFKARAKHRRHAARRHARRAVMTLAVLSFGAVGMARAQTAPVRPIG